MDRRLRKITEEKRLWRAERGDYRELKKGYGEQSRGDYRELKKGYGQQV